MNVSIHQMTSLVLRPALACSVMAIAAHDVGAQGPGAANAAAIDRYVDAFASRGHFSGTVLVAKGHDVVFEKSYGKPDYSVATAGTPATVYALASVTKPLTGIVARTLAARGTLGLDDTVAKWIPEFPNGTRITVAQLLAHRSGIPHRVTQPGDERRHQSAESMAQLIGRAPLAFEPGAQRLYSSAGYSLLARVLERAGGKPYAELLREIVLAPAGAGAAIDATEAGLAGLPHARGHFWTPEGALAAPAKDLSFLVGAGSLWATPRDLFNVARRVADSGYGTGPAAGARGSDGVIQWTGFSDGFMTIVDYRPSTDVTVVVTSNLLTGAAELIARDAARIAFGESVASPQVPVIGTTTLSAARRAQLEGTYSYAGSRHLLTFVSSTAALIGGEYLLITTSDTTMYAPQNYLQYHVVADESGNITALAPAGGGPFTITRVR